MKSFHNTIKGYKIIIELNPDDPGDIIIKSADNNPKLDPNSPEFDAALYEEIKAEQIKSLVEISHKISDAIKNAAFVAEQWGENIKKVIDTLQYNDIVKKITDAIQYVIENREELRDKLEEWHKVEPYLEEELKKPEYASKSIDELMAADDPASRSLFEQAFENAKAAMLADKKIEVDIKPFIDFTQGVDKINNTTWNLLENDSRVQIDGQLGIMSMIVGTENEQEKAAGIERNISYSISFSELNDAAPIMKRLTPFDKRVYFSIANLYKNGNEWISTTMIYHYMGNTGRPNATHRKKIFDSVKKLMGALITLNNLKELFPDHPTAKPYNYPEFDYTGNLLHAEFTEHPIMINGKGVEDAIHILRMPVLFEFAEQRRQITTFNRKVLEVPLDQRDSTLMLQDYLIEQIQLMKNGGRNKKMLYDTIYKEIRANTPMQQHRAKDKILTCLDYWKTAPLNTPTGKDKPKTFIKGYSIEGDGITIITETTKKQNNEQKNNGKATKNRKPRKTQGK